MERSGSQTSIQRTPRGDGKPFLPPVFDTYEHPHVGVRSDGPEAFERNVRERHAVTEGTAYSSEHAVRVASPPSAAPSARRPVFYASERCLKLRDIILLLDDERLRRTTRRAGDMEVYVIRMECGGQRSTRSEPKAIGDCLYIDVRDYMALREGVPLPRVGDAIRDLLSERKHATKGASPASFEPSAYR